MEGDKIMWEYIIITCMVTHFGGEPVNKCFSSVSEKKYPDVQICKAAAKAEDFRIYYTMRGTDAGLPVIKTVCGEVKDKNV